MKDKNPFACHTPPKEGDDVYWCDFDGRSVLVSEHSSYCRHSKPENGKCLQCAVVFSPKPKCDDCVVGEGLFGEHRVLANESDPEKSGNFRGLMTEFTYCPKCGRKL